MVIPELNLEGRVVIGKDKGMAISGREINRGRSTKLGKKALKTPNGLVFWEHGASLWRERERER